MLIKIILTGEGTYKCLCDERIIEKIFEKIELPLGIKDWKDYHNQYMLTDYTVEFCEYGEKGETIKKLLSSGAKHF